MSLSQIEGGERNVMQVIPSVAPKIYKRHPDFHLVSITLRNALVQVSTAEEKPAKWRRKTLPLRDAGNGGWAG